MPTTLGDPSENERALKNLNVAQFITRAQEMLHASGKIDTPAQTVNENLASMGEQMSKPTTPTTSTVESGFGLRNSGQLTTKDTPTKAWSKRSEDVVKSSPAQEWYDNAPNVTAKPAPGQKPKKANKRGKK